MLLSAENRDNFILVFSNICNRNNTATRKHTLGWKGALTVRKLYLTAKLKEDLHYFITVAEIQWSARHILRITQIDLSLCYRRNSL